MMGRGVASASARAYAVHTGVQWTVRLQGALSAAKATYNISQGNGNWMDWLNVAPIAGALISRTRVRILELGAGPNKTNLDVVGRVVRTDIAANIKHIEVVLDATKAAEYDIARVKYPKFMKGKFNFIYANNPRYILAITGEDGVGEKLYDLLEVGGKIIIQGHLKNGSFKSTLHELTTKLGITVESQIISKEQLGKGVLKTLQTGSVNASGNRNKVFSVEIIPRDNNLVIGGRTKLERFIASFDRDPEKVNGDVGTFYTTKGNATVMANMIIVLTRKR